MPTVFNIYIIYLFININIYVENMQSGTTRHFKSFYVFFKCHMFCD